MLQLLEPSLYIIHIHNVDQKFESEDKLKIISNSKLNALGWLQILYRSVNSS